MTRKSITPKLRAAVLEEYDHRCAICGSHRPQIHHIDEDHSNNDPLNLLPLCPNHHIRDQHSPTLKPDPRKIYLFRKFKDPAILKPQFHPIFVRQSFLEAVSPGEEQIYTLKREAEELIDFVQAFEMGQFYAKRLRELLSVPTGFRLPPLNGAFDRQNEKDTRDESREYRDKLILNRAETQALLVEMLRYQRWAHDA